MLSFFWCSDVTVIAHFLTQVIPILTLKNISHTTGINHGYLKGIQGIKKAL